MAYKGNIGILANVREQCAQAWQRSAIPVRLLGLGVRLIDLTDSSGQMDLFEQAGEEA